MVINKIIFNYIKLNLVEQDNLVLHSKRKNSVTLFKNFMLIDKITYSYDSYFHLLVNII